MSFDPNRRSFLKGVGALTLAPFGVCDTAPAFAAGGIDAFYETIANGNLIIPKQARNTRIFYSAQNTMFDVILTEVFDRAGVPFDLTPETKTFSLNSFQSNGTAFGGVLAGLMASQWDCRITDGVYCVFERATKNIVPGRPDLDTRWFTRDVRDWVSLSSFFEGMFKEANLPCEISPDCPMLYGGAKFTCHFREALKVALSSPLTFVVRDGVYCICPRPQD